MFWKTRSKLFWSLVAAIIAGIVITFGLFFFSETKNDEQNATPGTVDSTTFQKTPANKANTQERK